MRGWEEGIRPYPQCGNLELPRSHFMEEITHSTLLDRSDTVGLRTTSLQVEVTGQV